MTLDEFYKDKSLKTAMFQKMCADGIISFETEIYKDGKMKIETIYLCDYCCQPISDKSWACKGAGIDGKYSIHTNCSLKLLKSRQGSNGVNI